MNRPQSEQIVECTYPELPAGSRGATQCLDNGLQLLAVEVPTARQVRLVGAVGVGYLDEPAVLPGLAHLLEHALFLGSREAPMPGEFAAWVGSQGGATMRVPMSGSPISIWFCPRCCQGGCGSSTGSADPALPG
ncbi:insulinase family protein [Modicisalibacter luteus]|uniref:insulinase family protein n=1 Tax=Modicisalibacter luteus TaxID=453962 RepID=UPI00363EB0FB